VVLEGEGWFTPARVAEFLELPPSTLRTYASEFGQLLSPNARSSDAAEGRAFRHRRYSFEDLAILGRAKSLVEAGLSYRAALAQLSQAPEPPKLAIARPRAKHRVLDPNRGSASTSKAPDELANPIEPLASPPRPAITSAVADQEINSRPQAAIGDLAAQVARVAAVAEELSQRLARLEDQVDALRVEVRRLDRDDPPLPPPRQPHWLTRLLGIRRSGHVFK
jgi:DNA-binding transcriptional MerR regulator